ncbi:Acetyltransferase (GNAT) domain-containing protein [Halorientalis persicus]|jgi:GNAT superfamily N-acetyltransferase|uniref:Acetyltransferase (GNAT) domain-containing protein n=1 Tax=Halorientalis persicus TaxID=1367881 RepID=A0A1H8IL46_9EURY|nr:GNAT family N-acetyltransferase [Halorientalis persicus]SEN69234.1 Acetyltransferase (GNAT) domain-containing protein [Halorientalis persicus]
MEIREATVEDLPAVMTVFDGAMLATDVDAVREAIDRGDLLVAATEGRVLGACLLAGEEIDAVAVRRARRDQGIGAALVEAAADRRGRLVAEFDPRVRPFWASLGFEIEPADEPERYRGVRE